MSGQSNTVSSEVKMTYADYTRNTKEVLKRFAHGSRFSGALNMVSLHPEMKILDYGCGDGGFFEELVKKVPAENLFGFDPWLLGEMTFEGATTYADPDVLVAAHPRFFDVIYIMEVCEHLDDAALHVLFGKLRDIGGPDAQFVFGVPVETGFPGLVKNLYRLVKGRRQGATFLKAIKSFFSIPILRARHQIGWIGSHIGFDHSYFLDMLDYGGFEVTKRACLPLSKLGPNFNNEVYFICKRNGRAY
jgi:cyclopropane fatty-acyl-phospholipid synthase-like methyltransferase